MQNQITIAAELKIIEDAKPDWIKNTYVITDKFKRPRITVALMQCDDISVRGIAICGKKDHVNVPLGIIKAEGRATKAILQKKNTLPINRNEAIRALFEANSFPFKFKSEYNATRTNQELKLIEDM